jgi:hypothetical protein
MYAAAVEPACQPAHEGPTTRLSLATTSNTCVQRVAVVVYNERTTSAGVCGDVEDRQQQLQALLAGYPSNKQSSRHAPAAPFTGQQLLQQQQLEMQQPVSFPEESSEQLLYK